METIISRYRNITIFVVIIFAELLGLAMQVRRNGQDRPTRLIRVWAIDLVTPLERSVVWAQNSVSDSWHGYIYLRGLRQENRELRAQIEDLRLQQVRLQEDARQAQRLQSMLGFKEQYIAQTTAAQVIGLSGSDQSKIFYIDKGARDGIAKDMAVITAQGVVGKILRAYDNTAQVLMIDDQTSGVGTILEQSRLQGVLRGTPSGSVIVDKIMNDEEVRTGENVLTSGGDQIFPKGLLIGTVAKAAHGSDSFLSIRVKPAADLSKLEEVLVITKREEKAPDAAQAAPVRAVDVLESRLPSVPEKPESAVKPNSTDPKNPSGAPEHAKAPASAPNPISAQSSGTTAADPKKVQYKVSETPREHLSTSPEKAPPSSAAQPGKDHASTEVPSKQTETPPAAKTNKPAPENAPQ